MSSDLYKVGSNFIVGLSGVELKEDEANKLATLRPAGVVLFRNNIDSAAHSWPDALVALIADVRAAIGRELLLVSIDHEGGLVHRLPKEATHFPAAANWPERSYEVGAAMGRELRALSINLDFAPVLDVATNPDNPIIGSRAFSSDPKEVSIAARAFRKGLESQGVIACGKHFPGHGGTVVDSHLELPVQNSSSTEMEAVEFVPFRQLIEDGLQLIMTAHILYPKLDPDFPATLSRTIIQQLLENHFGFKGAVITDALEMQALSGYTREALVTQAIAAGVDLLLVAQPKGVVPIDEALTMAKGLLESLDAGRITEPLLRESHKRINQLLQYGKKLRQAARASNFDTTLLGCDAHQAVLNSITMKS
jgi:beta-N-acetylhexosaminidase